MMQNQMQDRLRLFAGLNRLVRYAGYHQVSAAIKGAAVRKEVSDRGAHSNQNQSQKRFRKQVRITILNHEYDSIQSSPAAREYRTNPKRFFG